MGEIKIGSLVKLKEEALGSVAFTEDFRDKVWVITDWTPAGANRPMGLTDTEMAWGDGWIQWTHRTGQDIVYEEDLILIA